MIKSYFALIFNIVSHFHCFIVTCSVLHVTFSFSFFSRVAWEAAIRYLPRSSSESWSQGWWMNTCLHVWTHWEYHLPATLSGIVQTHDNGFTLKHSFLATTRLMITFYILFTTFNRDLILKSKAQSTRTSYTTEHTGEVINITVL